MSLPLFAALAFVGAAILLLLDSVRCRRIRLVTSLRIGASAMPAFIGIPKKFNLLSFDALGVAVDVTKFPTALTNVSWSVSNTSIAAVNVTKPDGTEVELLGSAEGTVTLSVVGRNKDGVDIGKSVDVLIEQPVPLVASLEIVEA